MVSGPQEIQQMLVGYAKQETIDPLKALGRYLAFGLSGSICIGIGSIFLSLAALRFTQSFDSLEGTWASLVPYLASLLMALIAIFTVLRVLKTAKRKVI